MASRKSPPKKRAAADPPPVLPSPLIARQAVDGAVEPMVRTAPPLGRSGDLIVHKIVHDLLGADPSAIGAHVFRVKASFAQDTRGLRSVALRLDLDEDFPNLPVDALPARLEALQKAGRARCEQVLGKELHVLSVYFGGKKLR
jgi:hypothetical protein